MLFHFILFKFLILFLSLPLKHFWYLYVYTWHQEKCMNGKGRRELVEDRKGEQEKRVGEEREGSHRGQKRE